MTVTTLSARDQFRAACENRYTWDTEFPGYEGIVTLLLDGTTHQGRIRVERDLSFTVIGLEDETARKFVNNQLWEITIHRIRKPFEDTHGQNQFTLGEPQTDGSVEILVSGKAMGDRYGIRNNEVSLVHRHMGQTVVTIHTHSSHTTGQGYLSHRYDSEYRDVASGDLKGSSQFEDTFELVGSYYLLTERKIQSDQGTTQITFSQLQLLA